MLIEPLHLDTPIAGDRPLGLRAGARLMAIDASDERRLGDLLETWEARRHRGQDDGEP